MTKEEMKKDAEDAHIVEEQQQPKEENKKRSFLGKVWNGCCWLGKKAWEHKEEIATGVVAVIATKTYCDSKNEKKVDTAFNVGCTTGVISARVEHSPLTEEEKDGFYSDRGLNRSAFRNDEKIGTAIVEEIKAARK